MYLVFEYLFYLGLIAIGVGQHIVVRSLIRDRANPLK